MTIKQVQAKFTFDVENQKLINPYNIFTGKATSTEFKCVNFDGKPCWTVPIGQSGNGLAYQITFIKELIKLEFDYYIDNIDGFCILFGINIDESKKYHLVNVSNSYPSYGNYVWWNPDRSQISDGILDVNTWFHFVIEGNNIQIYNMSGELLYERSKVDNVIQSIELNSDANYTPYIANMVATFNYSQNYLDSIGLTSLWSKIKSLFATKTELASKANDSDVVHKSGDETISGIKTFNDNLVTKQINTPDSSSLLSIFGGTSTTTGANIDLYGEDESSLGGGFYIRARNSSGYKSLKGTVDGTLTWDGEFHADTFNGNLFGGISKLTNGDVYRDIDTGYLSLGGGSKYANGSSLVLGGMSNSTYAGKVILRAKDSSNTYELNAKCTDTTLSKNGVLSWSGTLIHAPDNTCDLGNSSKRFKDIYATNATINTSDRNAKQDISVIDDKLLDAWGNINPVTFKLISSVEQKGDKARIHTGYIAQDVKAELDKYGIDACKYGLFCYNSWEAKEEKSHEEERTDEEGNTTTVKVIDTPAREAGETYGLRYIECLVVECAYLRKKNKELEDKITKLEENLNA